MRGCDVSGFGFQPRDGKVNDCMFVRIRSLEKNSGFVSVAVYVLYASWTGCAALRGLLMIENHWAV